MKMKNGVLAGAALIVAAGSASARPYNGSDTMEVLTKRLVINCGALGVYSGLTPATFDYVGGGSGTGGTAMRNGTQDIAPQSRKMNAAECATTSVVAGPAGEAAAPTTTPQNLPVGRDGIAVVTSEANARRCDDDPNTDADFVEATADDFGATIAFSGTINVPSVGAYNIVDWRDVLRIIYTGGNLGNATSTPAQPLFAAPVFSANDADRIARCNSPLRKALVAQWDNIIQDVTSANTCNSANSGNQDLSGSCQDASGNSLPLRHAFRRDDLSGTTDTFLTLLGVPAINATSNPTPFCNGTDTQDNDPITVTCSSANTTPAGPIVDGSDGGPSENATKLNDEQCDWDRVGGLVQAVRVPTFIGTNNSTTTAGNRAEPTKTDLYPTVNCGIGNFGIRRPPATFASTFTCPDGAPFLFTGCLTPLAPTGSMVDHGDGTAQIDADCACVNAWTNRAPGAPDLNPSIPGVTNDGRGWNNYIRGRHNSGGSTSHPSWSTPANTCPVMRDERGVEVTLDVARVRVRSTTVNNFSVGQRVCAQLDATEQIGCLARASECSIGYAGRGAVVDQPNDDDLPTPPAVKDTGTTYNAGVALRLGPAVGDTTPDVRGPGTGSGEAKGYGPEKTQIFASTSTEGYQFARKLYINSIVGFNSVLSANAGPFTAATGSRLPSNGSRETDQLVQCIFNPASIGAGKSNALAESLQESGFLPLTPSSAIPTATEACN